mgnify:CR=1 FL=1
MKAIAWWKQWVEEACKMNCLGRNMYFSSDIYMDGVACWCIVSVKEKCFHHFYEMCGHVWTCRENNSLDLLWNCPPIQEYASNKYPLLGAIVLCLSSFASSFDFLPKYMRPLSLYSITPSFMETLYVLYVSHTRHIIILCGVLRIPTCNIMHYYRWIRREVKSLLRLFVM